MSGLGTRGNIKEFRYLDPKTGESLVKMGDLIFPPRKVWMKTFGCQMNYHDTERILSHLKDLNFSATEDKNEADLILFNTCAVRDLSNNKFYSQLGEMKKAKAKNEKLVVGVGGCVAQTEGKALVKKYRHLDFAFGTDVIDQINDMVFRVYAGDNKFHINSWDRSNNFSIETKVVHGTPQAFVNIIKGCNKYCSYCIVPYTRGKERSRRLKEVVEDVRRLVEYSGIQEVMLLGQNVNSYGKENSESLAQLIMALDEIQGLELLRYTTSHPADVTDELIEVHGTAKKLSKHLHLPVQSGSNTVLDRMLREYTIEHYLNIIEKLKSRVPEIVLSTDIIVGFPNETEEEYQATLNLLELVQYDSIYSYVYSPRANTRATKIIDNLPDDEKGRRLRHLQQFQIKIQEKIREKLVGQTFKVLIDGKSTLKGITKWKGRTNCNRVIHLNPESCSAEENFHWNWVEAKVEKATGLSLQGPMLNNFGKTLSH